MLGPVFSAEMLRAGRRGRAHILRWIYAGWLCLQLVYVFDATHAAVTYGMPPQPPVSRSKAASNLGQQFRDLVLGQQFTLIVLVTPAFVAGAITDEKIRGTLQGLLTAFVTPADIVLGKLAARIAQVGVLALVPLPLLAFVGQYAGVTPEFLLAYLAVTILLLFGLGGLSMLASVWLRQTRWAVIATYFALFAGYFCIRYGWVTGPWTDYFGLIRVLDPLVESDDLAESVRRLGQASLVWGGLGVVTTALAVWRLRPAYLRQLEARPRRFMRRGLAARRMPVRDVVAWKEVHVGGRVPLWLGVLLTGAGAAAVTAYVLYDTVVPSWRRAVPNILMQVGVYSFVLGTLMVGVRCSGSITGERERATWDGLMTSPLTVREIVRGKHRGALRATWPYLIAAWFGSTAVAEMMSHFDPRIQFGFLICSGGVGGVAMRFAPRLLGWVSVGLVLMLAGTCGLEAASIAAIFLGVSWLAMYFFAAVGLACSARSSSSWRSLLSTVALGYAGGAVLWCVGLPIGCIGSMILAAIVGALEAAINGNSSGGSTFFGPGGWFGLAYPVIMTLGMAILLWLVGRSILISAEKSIAKRDRIAPDWVRMIEYDIPRYGPTRHRMRR
jgi:ABC-type transport system involved in multi-copper enzyme maturation permease subunit